MYKVSHPSHFFGSLSKFVKMVKLSNEVISWLLRTPGPVPSTCWDQSFSELVVILPDYAFRISLGTFSILINTTEELKLNRLRYEIRQNCHCGTKQCMADILRVSVISISCLTCRISKNKDKSTLEDKEGAANVQMYFKRQSCSTIPFPRT